MDETLGIVTEIRDYASMGISYNDMAVLYRTNVGPRLLISSLWNTTYLLHEGCGAKSV